MLPSDRGLLEFERSATVALVATEDVVRCGPFDSVRDILSRHLDLDHFPVMADGRTVGVLSRPDGEGIVGD